MKITTLLETNTTPSSDPATNQSQQAPKFGRDPHVLEDEQLDEMTAGATGSGSVATGEPTNMRVQRRGKGSMLQGIKTSKKFPNSAAVKEGAEQRQQNALWAQITDYEKRAKATKNDIKKAHYMKMASELRSKLKTNDEQGLAEGLEEQVYKVVALDKSNALKKPTKLNVKASSIEDVFSRLAANDWYALSINGVEVVAGKRLKQDVAEASPEATFNVLKGLKTWQVVIMNNYYRGKYSDYSGRYYYVLASSPEEAEQVVLDNADAILQELLAMKSHNGRKILPRGSALRITADRIGEIRDGTEAGRMTTAGFKRMFGPQGPMMVKLSGGAVVDVQGQEQGVAEGYPGYAERGKELDAATKKIQANLDRRIRGKELDAATKKIQANLDKRIARSEKQGVAEGSDQELVKRQVSYWDQVAKEKKNKEREALKAKKAEYEKTPAGKAEKYWSQKGVAEGSDNIRSMIQQYEDMVELVYDLPPGRKKNIAIDKRDALEAQIEAMPGGKEALRKWARAYNDSFDEGVAEGSIKDAEHALARHGQYKVDHEKKYGPMSGADLHQHEVMRKQLLDKKRRAQTAYAKKQGVAEGTETAADIDKKIEFHKQGQAAAQYKGSMNKMHAAKIRELEAKKQALKQGVAEGPGFDKWADERAASQIHKLKNPYHPKTWHDVDPKLGKAVDKMSQAEKVKKGFAHPDTLKKGVAEDDAGDVEKRMVAKIEKEKQRLAKLKQTDPEAYKREMAKRKTSGKVPPVSTFEEQGVAEGDVVQFPKKHKSDLENTHSCVKCGGDLQGGTYMGHKVKVCMPCKQVYLPPNTGIDQRGNKVDEQGVAEYGDTAKGQKMLTKVQKRAVDRMIKADDKRDAKTAKKNQDTANRAWDRMTDVSEEKQRLDPKCWTGYKKQGTKMKGGVRVNNCVPVKEAEKYPEPEQEVIDATRRARLQREREPQGSEKIDAMLAQRNAQLQQYTETGKFWLKKKDTQEHISDAYVGKAAANQAALQLLKQHPELKGNIVITAWGPGETPVNEAELSEEQLLARDLKKQLELFKQAVDHDLGTKPNDKELGKKPKDKEVQKKK